MSDGIKMRETRTEFDAGLILSAMARATESVFKKFGAFVRTRAMSSIRSRKKISQPGMPPSSHEGSLKHSILFAWDPERKSVVIGPVAFRAMDTGPLLEEGGEGLRLGKMGPRRMHYRARPFMGPAFYTELDNLQPLWRNSVRAA